jgi:(p)ppGpp synthase/HD superfamily hydrolase
MALLCGASRGSDTGVVGLLHNVLEVSSVSEQDLRARFGDDVRAQVASLTVDRSRQWDAAYKRAYYETLNAGPTAARLVKVFDKLDNLYLLGLNPDSSVKTKYAQEIRTYILPMAQRDIPALIPYLTDLLNETILAEKLEMPAV